MKGLAPDDLYYNNDFDHYIDDGGILHLIQEESVPMEEDIIATDRIDKEDFVPAKLEVHAYYYCSSSIEKWLLAIAYYATDDDGLPREEAISEGPITLYSSHHITKEELKRLDLRDFYYHAIDDGISHREESVPVGNAWRVTLS